MNLSSLPNIADAEATLKILPSGETVRVENVIPFDYSDPKNVPRGNAAIAFTDEQGTWLVVYGLRGGPYKRRVSHEL